MSTCNLNRRKYNERIKRKVNTRKIKTCNWLLVTEGEKTEPYYFEDVIRHYNSQLENKINIKIEGAGRNTKSLVMHAEEFVNSVDKYNREDIYYSKIFVVFDKDDFKNDEFDNAIKMCISRGYIPLWSNESFELWFLLHFNYLDSSISREECIKKINECFKASGINIKYRKNDKDIFNKLLKYGSLENARKNSKKLHSNMIENKSTPSNASCTTVYKFFDELDIVINELK